MKNVGSYGKQMICNRASLSKYITKKHKSINFTYTIINNGVDTFHKPNFSFPLQVFLSYCIIVTIKASMFITDQKMKVTLLLSESVVW